MSNLASAKIVAPGVVDIINMATGDKMVSLRLAPGAASVLNNQYVDSVIDTVDKYLGYINKPNCQVSIYHAVFTGVGIVQTGNGIKNVVIKATGLAVAIINFYNVDPLFNLSLETGVAHASELYIAGIGRVQKAQASSKVLQNRRQAVRKIMWR